MDVIDALLAYLHFVAMMLLAALGAVEFLTLRRPLDAKAVITLSRVDAAYVAAGFLVLLSGAARFATTAKGVIYVGGNPLFWTKMVLFGTIAVMSLYMSWRYDRWVRHARINVAYNVPPAEAGSALVLVKFQLVLLAVLPLFAVMMVRGIAR
jgi:putative membrane protein